MAADDTQMEPRVRALEEGLNALRREVGSLDKTLNTALLGTLDGKPGIVPTLHSSLEASRANAVKLDALTAHVEHHGQQLDGLRLDRSKVQGIIIAVSALWAALGTILTLLFKFWK